MKIIFYSYSGVYSAVLAGAACIGELNLQEVASNQFLEVPYFGCRETGSKVRYLGKDQKDNQIYVLGVMGKMELIYRAMISFQEILQIPPHEIKVINTYHYLNRVSKGGERLAAYGFSKLGKFFFSLGFKKNLPLFLKRLDQKLKEHQY